MNKNISKYLSEIGRKGQEAMRKVTTEEQRQEWRRKGGKTRGEQIRKQAGDK